MQEKNIREPIISVLGHVDHGKTTFLDYIRGTVVATREAGGITQHIGATEVPFPVIKKICGSLLEKLKLKIQIRGLLFIDTPGHEAFTTLRKRGGSVADLAILVVDIKEGLMPQSIETIQILKQYKTPFVVAANKIDLIHGWQKGKKLEEQFDSVKREFNEKFYSLVSQLSQKGFDPELFSKVEDFSRQLAIVPISSKTGEGIPELLMVLIGLTQQYLSKELSIEVESKAKGTVLEVKETKGLGTTIDVIIYDGVIKKGDEIIVGSSSEREPILTKVKALLKPMPLDEMRDPKKKFFQVDAVYAASGVKIVAPNLEKAIAGTPVYVGGKELIEKIKKEVEEVEIHRSDLSGVTIKADTVGSLEALIKMLSERNIHIRRATIGKVSKQDVIEASAVSLENKYLGVILAFNSQVLDDANTLARDKGIKIFRSRIIYKLIEDYEEWVKKEKELEKKGIMKEVTSPTKFRILPNCVFRQSKPAICGVEILAGTLKTGCKLMREEDGKVVGKIKEMQKEKEKIDEAKKGEKVAIAIDGVTIGRQLNESSIVYSFLSDEDIVQLKEKEELSDAEKELMKEIKEIKKKRQTQNA
jgi:translation initiation factor 5B